MCVYFFYLNFVPPLCSDSLNFHLMLKHYILCVCVRFEVFGSRLVNDFFLHLFPLLRFVFFFGSLHMFFTYIHTCLSFVNLNLAPNTFNVSNIGIIDAIRLNRDRTKLANEITSCYFTGVDQFYFEINRFSFI